MENKMIEIINIKKSVNNYEIVFDRVLEMKRTGYKKERIEKFINIQYERNRYINLDEKYLLLNIINNM